VLTMMLPYYAQDPEAPFPHVFEVIGWNTIKWIVSIGAIFALCTSLLGAMFPLPRVLYAMGNDGILYKFMKRVHPKTKTPLIATILSGVLAAIMATIFNLHQLIDMMSIGTLLAYTIVAVCVLVLHYDTPQGQKLQSNANYHSINTTIHQLVNFKFTKEPSALSSNIAKIGVVIFSILSTFLCGLLKFEFTIVTIVLMTMTIAGLLLTMLIISRQPVDNSVELSFKVPLVPLLPCLSILINLYLMFQLDGPTWVRFGVWVLIGEFFKIIVGFL
jgi:solute carrier family 7 (cationic amino acid transporter), member 3